MNAAIVLSAHNSEAQARELLCAARSAGAQNIFIWAFHGAAGWTMHLPAQQVLSIRVTQPSFVDSLADALGRYYLKVRPELMLFYGDGWGNDLAVRFSHLCGGSLATNITGIRRFDGGVRVTRRAYGLHLVSELTFQRGPFLFSIDGDSFEKLPSAGVPGLMVETLPLQTPWRLRYELHPREQVEDLSGYPVVLIGGRGLGSKENAERLMRLGTLLGAGVGATRPAVFNGWFGLDRLVGASGERIQPKLCVVFGASGCAPLMLGIKKSGRIIAVNSDPNAQIFDACDEGVVGDCGEIIGEMLAKAERGEAPKAFLRI
ncbi:MAG: electron transfer flavoprotein subunit alpha/FixB family protein [Bacillota bacterium]